MTTELNWDDYLEPGHDFTDFPHGAVVVDIGCGWGGQLQLLGDRRCRAVGIELDEDALVRCRRQGLRVVRASAEALPFRDASADGCISKVMLAFTDEPHAVAEIARVLKPGGRLEACYNAAGYYARYAVSGPTWRRRVYGVRTLFNTLVYSATGRRLPGWIGDTVYQSADRLARYYAQSGLRLVRERRTKTFMGRSVFIYHTLEKRQ